MALAGEQSRRFGRYRVIEKLGAGAMGAVYRARDDSLGREVAIKTIRFPGLEGFRAEMFHARFENEARAVAALAHPHVVAVHDVGVEDRVPYLVMELASGPSLSERLEAGPLGHHEVRALGAQIGGALAAAHARGVVHRDVKPGNILEARSGSWKLADFGVARVPESSLTLTGQFLGSPAYAAPEALERGEFGPPSDVYGLGATLYQALTGTLPFGERGRLSAGALAPGAEPRSILELAPGTPPDLAGAVGAALDPDPARRPSAAELAQALGGPAQHVQLPPAAAAGSGRIIGIAVAVVVLVIGIGIGAGLSGDDEERRPAAREAPAPGYAGDWGEPPGRGRGHERKWREKQAKRWRKVDEKLRKGEIEDAREELAEILEEDPYDERAQELYEQLAEYEEDWD